MPSALPISRFCKRNRLSNRKQISMLFREGKTLNIYPFRVFYLQKKEEEFLYNQVLFSVSKRKIPSAVQRNKIKRVLRESYRFHQHLLDYASDHSKPKFVFFIGYVYTGDKEQVQYTTFNSAVLETLRHFKVLLDIK